MARPKKGEEKGRTCQMAFRTAPTLRSALEAVAKKQRRSLSDVINEAILLYLPDVASGDGDKKK